MELYGSFSYLEEPTAGVSLIQSMCRHKDPVNYSYNKSQRDALFLYFCHASNVDCLLADSQHY